MTKLLTWMHREESGATMVEYAIMAAAVAAVIVFVAYSIGLATDNSFETLNECLPNGAGC